MNRDNAFIEIAKIDSLSIKLAAAVDREVELADARSLEKDAAIRRLVASGTYTSVTAAEKFVEADSEFLAHRRAERDAVAARIVMQGKLDAQKLRARLAVELCAIDEQAREFDDEVRQAVDG